MFNPQCTTHKFAGGHSVAGIFVNLVDGGLTGQSAGAHARRDRSRVRSESVIYDLAVVPVGNEQCVAPQREALGLVHSGIPGASASVLTASADAGLSDDGAGVCTVDESIVVHVGLASRTTASDGVPSDLR